MVAVVVAAVIAAAPGLSLAQAVATISGTVRDASALERELAPCLDRPFGALSPVERGILLLAAYEFRHQLEVPYRVVINEAVELAKEYGGTDGYKFVNGVLDRLAPRMRTAEAKPA